MQKRSMRVVADFADVLTSIASLLDKDQARGNCQCAIIFCNPRKTKLILFYKWNGEKITTNYAWILEGTSGPGCVHSIQNGTLDIQHGRVYIYVCKFITWTNVMGAPLANGNSLPCCLWAINLRLTWSIQACTARLVLYLLGGWVRR